MGRLVRVVRQYAMAVPKRRTTRPTQWEADNVETVVVAVELDVQGRRATGESTREMPIFEAQAVGPEIAVA